MAHCQAPVERIGVAAEREGKARAESDEIGSVDASEINH